MDTAEQLLPLDHLAWENFERLCYRLIRLDATYEHARLFGTRGQDQCGIDIFARKPDRTYATYQCRRVATMTANNVQNAVKDFLDGAWAARSSSFYLCTSLSMVRTEHAQEIENQARLLRARRPSIAFHVWDAEELSARLKDHPQLVVEFFGQPWLERFAPHHAGGESATEERVKELIGEVTYARGRVRVVLLDWAPARLQRVLSDLHERDPERFERLTETVGTPPHPAPLAALVAVPPVWADQADGDFWELLARLAESQGEWSVSTDAWVKAADRRDVNGAVRSLISGAASAAVAQDQSRHDELVSRAETLDRRHPRLRLEQLDERTAPEVQLEALDSILGISSHPDDRLLITARMALCRLLLPDVDGARDLLPEIDQLGAGSAVATAVALNVSVQQGRLDVMHGRPLDAGALREVHDRALALRERLARERRWEESARLLMLAADAVSLLDERRAAATVLRTAKPEELASPTGAVVLADSAASRALDFRLALELLRDAPDDDLGVRRIRAEALQEVGTTQEQQQAREELEALVEEGGEESAEAAFIRLAATLGGHEVPWSEAAEDYLMQNGYERAAVTARAFYLARWKAAFEQAEALLRPHLQEPWAKIARLRLAIDRGAHTRIRQAADDLMSIAPTQSHRLEAGRGYAMVGDFPRSKEVLVAIARDNSAPRVARGQAYALLMRVVGRELGDWDSAATLHAEWVRLRPNDAAVSRWAPTIANRRNRR